MNIIFVNRYFHPDHSATSQMLTGVALGLARSGAAVHVVTSRLRYDGPSDPLPSSGAVEGVKITRVWTSSFGRAALIGRAFDYATFYLTAAFAVWHLARRGDIIVAKTDPPMMSVVLAAVAWLRGAHLVNWLQDIFPEVAEELGIGRGRLRGPLFALMKRLRDRSLKTAAFNVVLGNVMARRVEALGVPANRIRVISNWADGSLVKPVAPEANSLRREWGLTDKFVVGYSGNLGRAHDVETMLEAISITERTAPNLPRPVAWLFVGGGAQAEKLQLEVKARGLASVNFKPYQPQDKLAESLSTADVHLVSLRPELEGLIVPSKFYGIAAAGRATIFIGAKTGQIAQSLEQAGGGITVDQGDGAALAAAVLDLASHPELAGEMGQRARATFEREHDLPIAIAHWRALLVEVDRKSTKEVSTPA